MSRPEAKSPSCQIFKFQNLSQFLRFRSNFWHVSSIFIQVQVLYSNQGSYTTPSLISQGVLQKPPPSHPGILDPLSSRVNLVLTKNNYGSNDSSRLHNIVYCIIPLQMILYQFPNLTENDLLKERDKVHYSLCILSVNQTILTRLCYRRWPVRRATGNGSIGHYFSQYFVFSFQPPSTSFWHEGRCCILCPFGRSTGNGVSGLLFSPFFFLFLSFLFFFLTFVHFSHRWSARIKKPI